MSNLRNEQFAGFAYALMRKLASTGFTDFGQDELTVARAAYDLVEHALGHIYSDWTIKEMLPDIPDMVELPEENK